MEKNTVVTLRQPGDFEDPLTDVLQQGARQLLAQAVEAEVANFLVHHADLTNNSAERALRALTLGRKSCLFAGSDRGGDRTATMYTLIGTAKLNDIDPQACLADILKRIAEHPVQRIDELLPWNWKTEKMKKAA